MTGCASVPPGRTTTPPLSPADCRRSRHDAGRGWAAQGRHQSARLRRRWEAGWRVPSGEHGRPGVAAGGAAAGRRMASRAAGAGSRQAAERTSYRHRHGVCRGVVCSAPPARHTSTAGLTIQNRLPPPFSADRPVLYDPASTLMNLCITRRYETEASFLAVLVLGRCPWQEPPGSC